MISLSSQYSSSARLLLIGKASIPLWISPIENTLTKTLSTSGKCQSTAAGKPPLEGSAEASSTPRGYLCQSGSRSQSNITANIRISFEFHIQPAKRRPCKKVRQIVDLLMNRPLPHGDRMKRSKCLINRFFDRTCPPASTTSFTRRDCSSFKKIVIQTSASHTNEKLDSALAPP